MIELQVTKVYLSLKIFLFFVFVLGEDNPNISINMTPTKIFEETMNIFKNKSNE